MARCVERRRIDTHMASVIKYSKNIIFGTIHHSAPERVSSGVAFSANFEGYSSLKIYFY